MNEFYQKTPGLIYPGSYHFNTAKAERMEIIAGSFSESLSESEEGIPLKEKIALEVPAKSCFTL